MTNRLQSFQKSRRLLAKPAFDLVMQRGSKTVCKHLVIYRYSQTPAQTGAALGRLGLVVSKKVGSAVVRNRIKRCVRDVFRKLPEQMIERQDFVVIARVSASAPNNKVADDFLASVTKCFQKSASATQISGDRSPQ